jgi:hypothetical protein
MSLNCCYCTTLRPYMSMENHGGIISTEWNSRFVHQISLAILSTEISRSKAGGAGEGNYEFCLSSTTVILRRVL